MQIFFCEKCSKRLSDVDIEKGAAIVVKDLVYCRACAQTSGIHAAPRQDSSQKDKPKTGRHTNTSRIRLAEAGQIRSKPPARQYLIPLAIAGIAVLVLIVFAVFMVPKRLCCINR